MKIHDVTVALRPGLVSWPGEPGPIVVPLHRITDGDAANVSLVSLGTHTGTHVDPPVHFIDGTASVDRLSLDALIGTCTVVAYDGQGDVSDAWLDAHVAPGTERLLLRTRNSERWRDPGAPFDPSFVALAPSGARWAVERRLRLVGIDYLSIEAFDAPGHPVHHTLLGAGVVVIEGLDLRAVAAGTYELVCAPLKVADGDGAPARVLLIER